VTENLPVQLDAFIGRETELQYITQRLPSPDCRLITLAGPGGIGKTRLAVEAGLRLRQHFRDGVTFVPLQPVMEPAHALFVICDTLGLSLFDQASALDQIIEHLRHRHMLLILDNFEHLLGAVPMVVALLKEAPGIRVLVTSREVLNIQGEQVIDLRGLSLPEVSQEGAPAGDAVELFIARAQQVRHEFSPQAHLAEIARICRLVEGMPLAIELAAAWVRTLPVQTIAAEIERNLDFLSSRQRDIPERHRTMRAVFDHSWRLLTPDEQLVLRRLSVFRGPFTADAAVKVAATSFVHLSALVDKSLLRVDEQETYSVHELLRQYAGAKLEENPDEITTTRDRHCEYYLKLLAVLDPKIKSGEQAQAVDTIERSLANIRQAWLYAVETHRGDLVADAHECLTLYYQMRCRQREGYDMFTRAAARFRDDAPLYSWLTLARSWFTNFGIHVSEDERNSVEEEAANALLQHRVRDRGAMTIGALCNLSMVHDGLIDEMLAASREKGDQWSIAWIRGHKGVFAAIRGDIEEAKRAHEARIAMCLEIGDHWGATWSQAFLGQLAVDEGRLDDAFALYLARLRACEDVGDIGGVAWTMQALADVSLALNDAGKAVYYCRESLRISLDVSNSLAIAQAILRIAYLFHQTGNTRRAVALCLTLKNERDTMAVVGRHVNRALDTFRAALGPDELRRIALKVEPRTARQLGVLLLQELAGESPMPDDVLATGLPESLSERELEVLRLVASGLSNREIAERLVVTVGTVKKHLNNIFGKLGVGSRTEAIARARELSLIA